MQASRRNEHTKSGLIWISSACLLALLVSAVYSNEAARGSLSVGEPIRAYGLPSDGSRQLKAARYAPINFATAETRDNDESDEAQIAGQPTLEDLLADSVLDQWLSNEQDEERSLNKRRNFVDASPNNYRYEVNYHLPATSPFGSDDEIQFGADNGEPTADLYPPIRGPVNEPDEFEAKLGQITDQLNHLMSNSPERHRLLVGLLNSSIPTPAIALGQSGDSQLLTPDLIAKLDELLNGGVDNQSPDQDEDQDDSSAAPTSEYIDQPLALFGHKQVQGGAGEGSQLLGPEGTFENMQVVKSDSAIPSYCHPPNPCPLGYTAANGCLENFVNSASFSREYQSKQRCTCDNEHSLFNCGWSNGGGQTGGQDDAVVASSTPSISSMPGDASATNKLDTLARTIQNRFGDLASIRKLINSQQEVEGAAGPVDSEQLIRSTRKWSPDLHYHKMELD